MGQLDAAKTDIRQPFTEFQRRVGRQEGARLLYWAGGSQHCASHNQRLRLFATLDQPSVNEQQVGALAWRFSARMRPLVPSLLADELGPPLFQERAVALLIVAGVELR